MELPLDETDFGVTLAKWGVPDGPYLVLPFVGSTSVRDFWRLPVDQYFDPLSWYANEHDFDYNLEYLPNMFYLVTLRAARHRGGRPARRRLRSVRVLSRCVPTAPTLRDLRRPAAADVIEQMQGANDEDIDKLLDEQHQYEKKHPPQRE